MSLANARRRMAGLGLGIENDEEVAPVEGEVPVVNPEAEETVEQEVMEVTEAEGEVQQQEEAVDQLEEAAATMESIYASVQASLESGGLSPDAAVYLNHAVTATLRSVGVTDTKMPSMESFGGASGKLAATKVSLEGIGDWLKTLWQAIKNAVLKAIAWVKDLFARLIGGADKLLERAKKLKEEAGKMKSEKPKEKITFRSVSKLHTKGKADAKDFQDGLDTLALNVTAAYDEIPTAVANASAASSQAILSLQNAKSNEEANKVFEALADQTSKTNGAIVKAIKDKNVMSGGVVMKAVKGENDQTDVTVSIAPAQKFAQIAEDAQMEALDKKAVEAMLDAVILIAEKLKSKKDTVKKAEDATEAAVKDYEKAVESIDKDKGGVSKFIDAAKLKWALRSIRKRHLSTLGSLSTHAFNASRAALVLCEKSIAAYGTDKSGK